MHCAKDDMVKKWMAIGVTRNRVSSVEEHVSNHPLYITHDIILSLGDCRRNHNGV